MNQEVNSSILEKVDVFFTKIFSGLFKWVWLICLFIVGASACAIQYLLIFGNNAGLSDVSTVEFFFFVSIAGLIWRHWYYAKKNSQSIFVTMAKTLMNVGIVIVFLLALSAVIFFVAFENGKSLDNLIQKLFTANYFLDLITMAFWLCIFYFSAPVEGNNKTLETVQVEKNYSKSVTSDIQGSDLDSSDLNSSEIEQPLSDEQATVERKEGNENEAKV